MIVTESGWTISAISRSRSRYVLALGTLLACSASGCTLSRADRSFKAVSYSSGTSISSSALALGIQPSDKGTTPADSTFPVVPASFIGTIDSNSADSEKPKPNTASVVIVSPSVDAIETSDEIGSMSLLDFESWALSNNPTLQQLAATTRKAAGFKTQVGLRANPTIGYQGMQLADKSTDQHTAFIDQQIITGGKRGLNEQVLNEAIRAQLWELEAQKFRIQTDIRIKFYDAFAAQERIRLIGEFQKVAAKGLEIAELRKKAKEGSQVEVLQAKIQLSNVELVEQQARVAFAAAWRELSALSGCPQSSPCRLSGSFEDVQPADWSSMETSLLDGSPEYKAALARVQQARANIERQEVQAIPNVGVQLAAGVDRGTNSSLINLQVGAPVPVFNKNQGNIAAAKAEYARSLAEVKRIENSIQLRVASVSREFDSALAAVTVYKNEILPNAKQTLEMAETAYRAGEFSFLEVLTVRRTYFESNLQYLVSRTQLVQSDAKVKGFVLTGGLDPTTDQSGDDSLRGMMFSQQ
jgi:outer membrane protein, heavy metal efflux system